MSLYPVRTKSISPEKAMMYSALFPGGGQFYTKRYAKGILFLGLETSLAFLSCKNYEKSLEYEDFSPERDFYKHESVSYALYFLGAYLFSIADAYVSAHFFNVEHYFTSNIENEKNR